MTRLTTSIVALLAASALSACGSTVQQTSEQLALPGGVAQGDGLQDGAAPGAVGQESLGEGLGQETLDQGGLAGGGSAPAVEAGAPQQGAASQGVGSASGSGAESTVVGSSRAGTRSVPTAATSGPVGAGGASGAARVTDPITLGLLVQGSANGAAAAAGADYSTSTTSANVTKALVRFYNKNGGIAGRKIKPVYYEVPATAGNYQIELQAACAKFTQDNKVAVAVSTLANAYFANYEQCLTKAGVPDFAGATGTTDDRDLAAFPGLVTVSAPSTNRRFSELLGRFGSSGYLTPKNKIGVIVESCPYNTRAYADTIAPLAKKAGLTLVRRDINCINGFDDASAAIASFGSAVLPFRSAGVDRVVFVSNFEIVGLFAFENQANSQGYSPSYALTSTSGGAALPDLFEDRQLPRMRGVGWTPVLDVSTRVQASPATKRCRAMLASEGVTPKSKADDLFDIACEQFFLLEATLKASGGRSGFADVLGGLRSLKTGYTSAYTLAGATDYTTRRDGPGKFAVWGYRSACSCMDYLSPPS